MNADFVYLFVTNKYKIYFMILKYYIKFIAIPISYASTIINQI